MTICKLLEAILATNEVKGLEWVFVFCCVWCLGAGFSELNAINYRRSFSDWWKDKWKVCKFPAKGMVFDYYVDMGGAAYGYLHGAMGPSAEASAGFSAFEELEQKFCQVVDLLAEIAENSGLQSNSDLLRHCDAWLSSGSERARRRLIRAGIVPISGRALSTSH